MRDGYLILRLRPAMRGGAGLGGGYGDQGSPRPQGSTPGPWVGH